MITNDQVLLIETLQKVFGNCEEVIVAITEFAHPFTSVTLIVPLLIILRCNFQALQLVTSWCLADNLNLILKWIFRGDRPYWMSEALKQYRTTCETGYGMPSGHIMCTTLVITMLYYFYYNYCYSCNKIANTYHYVGHKACRVCACSSAMSPSTIRVTTIIAKVFVIVSILLMSFSRIFTGSHFVGQTLMGSLCGYLLAYFAVVYITPARFVMGATKEAIEDGRHQMSVCGVVYSIIHVVCTLATYLVISYGFKLDPLNSVQKAVQGCKDQESVKYTGSFLGDMARLHGAILGTTLVYRLYFRELLVSFVEVPVVESRDNGRIIKKKKNTENAVSGSPTIGKNNGDRWGNTKLQSFKIVLYACAWILIPYISKLTMTNHVVAYMLHDLLRIFASRDHYLIHVLTTMCSQFYLGCAYIMSAAFISIHVDTFFNSRDAKIASAPLVKQKL